jgi:hypothetical protein
LRELVPGPPPGLRARDRHILTLIDADLDRFLGRHVEARLKLAKNTRLAQPNIAGALWWLQVALDVDGVGSNLGWLVELVEPDRSGREAAPLARAAVALLGASAATAAAQSHTAARFLRVAHRALDSDRANHGRWLPRLHEQLAMEAITDGSPAEAERHRQLARDLYARLGDEVAAKSVAADGPLDRYLRGPESPTNVIELTMAGDAITARTLVSSRTMRVVISEPGDRVVAELGRNGPFGRAVADLVLVGTIGRLLGELAFGPGGSWAETLTPNHPLAIRLLDQTLAALPWELMSDRSGRLARDPCICYLHRVRTTDQPDGHEVWALQRALRESGFPVAEDGLLGRETRAAIVAVQERAGLPPTGIPDGRTEQLVLARLSARTVMLVRPRGGGDAMSSRAYRHSSLPIESIYNGNGLTVTVMEAPALSALAATLTERPPAILHIEAGLLEDSGQPLLDLAGEWELSESRASESDRYGASSLGSALASLVPKPIVVLDPPAPRSGPELARQLLLRNAFASELYALGGARAMLGLGLAAYGDYMELWGAVIQGLAAGQPLGDVVGSVRRLADPARRGENRDERRERHTDLVFGAAALFARSPDVRPPWRE